MAPSNEASTAVSIACVDDDPHALQFISAFLQPLKANIRLFSDPNECLRELQKEPADILITDLDMPGLSGLDVLAQIKKSSPETDVIIATGAADKPSAIQALKLGAYDFFEKPVEREQLLASVTRTVKYRTALQERDKYQQQLSAISEKEARRWGLKAFVGKSKAFRDLVTDIKALQKSDRTSVLVTGESGTGKELVARAIHSGSTRSTSPFLAVNCSAIPDNLAESILFGHVRGAFTGATSDKKGSFQLADGGTLFLDEIGDMLPVIQAKLLRVLEDQRIEPVGSTQSRQVNVRIIAATNANLDQRVADGKFREDLFHRLAAFRIRTPPLRERREDIPLLAQHFTNLLAEEMGLPPRPLPEEVLDLLARYDYPGNARELRNLIEQALIRCPGGVISIENIILPRVDLSGENARAAVQEVAAAPGLQADDLPLNLRELEKLAIKQAMIRTGGNVSEAARLLGIGRTKLYRELGGNVSEAAGAR